MCPDFVEASSCKIGSSSSSTGNNRCSNISSSGSGGATVSRTPNFRSIFLK